MKKNRKSKPVGITRRRQWKVKFLQHLAECGNVKLSADAAGVGRRTVYTHRQSDKDFAAKWAEAMEDAADVLEAEAHRRAVAGCDEPVIYEGKLCGRYVDAQGRTVADNTPGATLVPLTVKKFSDTLLIFLLKGARPAKYRETHHHVHDGNVGILRTAADGESEAAQLLGEIRERLGVDGTAA
jgi:hypothetical protein